jgi:hypothetical protein
VALTELDGDAGNVGKLVAAALDDDTLDVVPAKDVKRAIKRLGLGDELSDRDIQKIARELGVDAIVTGTVDGERHRLHLAIFAHGKPGRQFDFRVVKSKKFGRLLHDRMVAKIASIAPMRDDAATSDDPPAKADADSAKKKKKAKKSSHKRDIEDDVVAAADAADEEAEAKRDDDAPPSRRTKQVAASDDEDVPARETVIVESSLLAHTRGANRFAIRADVGSSLLAHSLQFNTRSFDNAPHSYSNAPVPGARFEAEMYPFAFGDAKGAAAGLGAAVDFDQTLSLKLHAAAEPGVPLKTLERHYSVGVRYRIALGSTAAAPTVTVGAGYGQRTFTVDRSGLMTAGELDLPNINYTLFNPGLALRVPLGSTLAVTVGGRAWLITSAGEIEHNDQYGQATVIGGEATAGLDVMLGSRLALRVTGELAQVNFKFAGTGTLSNSRDGDPNSIDVKRATDRYVGGAATLAVLY